MKDRKVISKGHLGESLVQPLIFHIHNQAYGEGDYRCGAKSFNTHENYMDEEKHWLPLPMCPKCFADRYPEYEGEMPKTLRDYIGWIRKNKGWKGDVAIAGSDQHQEDQRVEEDWMLRSFIEVKE